MESPEFAVASRWNQDINSFSLNTPLEMDHSRIIGWLLDPCQPHGLQGTALKALFDAAKSSADAATVVEAEEMEKQGMADADKEKLEDERRRRDAFFKAMSARKFANSLENVDVELEVSVESSGSTCRLDILVSNPDDEWMIVIENKSGSGEGLDQTTRYKAWKESQFSDRRDYPVLLIFMDLFGKKAKCTDGGWISLDYEWMNDVIRQVITAPATAPRIRIFLADYLSWYMDDEDDWFDGANEAAVKLVQKYPKAVAAANQVRKAYSAEKRRLSEYLLPEWSDLQQLSYKIWQNRETIWFLTITDARETHEKAVSDQIRGIEIDVSSKLATYYCRSEWDEKFPSDGGYWPVCIKVEHSGSNDGKHSFMPTLRVRPDQLEAGSDKEVELKNIVAGTDIKTRRGQIRFNLPLIDKPLIIESSDEIVLPSVSDVKRWVESADKIME